jgi:hypothetical protein
MPRAARETACPAACAQVTQGADARIVAVNIPGASGIAQIGTFLNVPPPQACAIRFPASFPNTFSWVRC